MSEVPASAVDLVPRIRAALRQQADPALAPGQQAYMKSSMPFLGVRLPETRRLAREASVGATPAELVNAAVSLWDAATHREERYAAMALLGARPLRADPALVPVIDHMVRSGQWWDYTDELSHRVTELLDARPRETAALVRAWSTDGDLWIRRIAIIAQLGRRERTDAALLEAVILPNIGDPGFFIRKAIGWALRDRARTDPAWVQRFADTHPLSALSRREALKHL